MADVGGHERLTPVGLHVSGRSTSVSRAWWDTRKRGEQNKQREEAIAAIGEAFENARAFRVAQARTGTPGVPRQDRDLKWEAMRRRSTARSRSSCTPRRGADSCGLKFLDASASREP